MTDKTLLDASSTLYIDFESNKAGELFLVGFDGGSGYTTWILHEELRGWAEGKGFRFATLDDVLDLVCQYKTIVAYSTIEMTVLNRIASERGRVLPSGISYLNARKVAVTWANKTRKTEFENLPILGKQVDRYVRPKRNALVGLARLVGMHSSATHGFGVVTKRIGQVRKGLAAKSGQFEQLTRHQKVQAAKVITHNRFDVEAMKKLVTVALNERPTLYTRYLAPLAEI